MHKTLSSIKKKETFINIKTKGKNIFFQKETNRI